MQYKLVLFYDGDCGFCNNSVRSLIALDKRRVFKYSTLQGDLAIKVLPESDVKDISSVILFKEERVYKKSKAIMEILNSLGGLYAILSKFMSLFPGSFLDYSYSLIAKNRYILSSKKNRCFLPSKKDMELFV